MFVQDRCSDTGIDYVNTARLLRFTSEKLSKAAKKFAAIIANADASAVSSNFEEELAQDMVNKLSVKFGERTQTASTETSCTNKGMASAAA